MDTSSLTCIKCDSDSLLNEKELKCANCGTLYLKRNEILDFAPHIADNSKKYQPGIGQRMMENKLFLKIYERSGRNSFIKFMAQNWNGDFKESDEVDYLNKQMMPPDGLVVDVACSAGKWTKIIVNNISLDRIVGVDLSWNMLEIIKKAIPGISLLRASAHTLPFPENSIAGVNCWNALQLIREPDAFINEVARIVKPGGLLTCFTYGKSKSWYRLIQHIYEKIVNVRSFKIDQLKFQLDKAGMDMINIEQKNLALMFAARKR